MEKLAGIGSIHDNRPYRVGQLERIGELVPPRMEMC